MRKLVYGCAIVCSYVVLYWMLIVLWSFAGLARFGGVVTVVEVVNRGVAIPFLAGWALAFSFRDRLQLWALGIAPFFASIVLIAAGVDWNAITNPAFGFLAADVLAAFACVGGAMLGRKPHLGKSSGI